MWWHTPLITAFGRQRHVDLSDFEASQGLTIEFQASQGYIVRSCLNLKKVLLLNCQLPISAPQFLPCYTLTPCFIYFLIFLYQA